MALRPSSAEERPRLRRVLLYTHNSIGQGHAVRCLAVLTGMRRQRPEADFLVLTGSELPQMFLAEGLEVLRLPGLRQELAAGRPLLRPRRLHGLAAEELVGLRRRIIAATARDFAPDAVLVEHYPAGLRGEALPLLRLAPGTRRRPRPVLVHLGRGAPCQPAWPGPALPGLDQLLAAYDLRYVLDDPPVAGAGEECPGPSLAYLGPVASRPRRELPPRHEVLARFGLGGRGMVLVSLGRGGPVATMARALLAGLPAAGLGPRGVVLALDPYLDPAAVAELRTLAREAGALAVPFLPYLVELVAAADLVVCRGGYNAVVELLLTGTPALVVPEAHPSGEQERRCQGLPPAQIVVAGQEEIVAGRAEVLLRRALALPPGAGRDDCDKYAVGLRLVEEVEARLAARAGEAGA